MLACDTVVAIGATLLGKPADAAQAREHLTRLAGATHTVISAVEVCDDAGTRAASAQAQVTFDDLGGGLLDWYLATGEWEGKAGAYAIQGHGAALVTTIEGHPSTVVGLPVPVVLELLPGLLG